ncbi:hypothetical protein FACS1894186_7440 [Alphaproteobacteria bacterium]|nr:hypothetical protein FACS1894186_7440 [Alphaproteobacteria bacterium]
MHKINDYINQAMARNGFASKRQLSLSLGMAHNAVFYLTKRDIIPTDETLLKLADLAGIPAEEALLDLAQWRAKTSDNPRISLAWEKIRAALAASGSKAVMLLIFLCFSSKNAAATPIFDSAKTVNVSGFLLAITMLYVLKTSSRVLHNINYATYGRLELW